MRRERPERPLVTARRAVAALFLLNAVAYANVVPRLPAIKSELGLSNTSLGAAIAAVPVGALLAGPVAGWLVARFGSGRLAVGCGVAFGLVLPCFALAPMWSALAAAFLVYGAFDSVMDVSMNAHALRVQRGWKRSIINSLHGLWSVGAVVRAGGVLTAASVATGLAVGEPAAIVVGFALAGLGTAPLFPLAFHAAGDLPGVSTGNGVAAVAWWGASASWSRHHSSVSSATP